MSGYIANRWTEEIADQFGIDVARIVEVSTLFLLCRERLTLFRNVLTILHWTAFSARSSNCVQLLQSPNRLNK